MDTNRYNLKYGLKKPGAIRGFTIIELVVSIGILALMIGFSSVIFKFSIDAHRVSTANSEIMQKFRAITGQLNRDFRGLRKDAPMFVKFLQLETNELNRYDQIMFFADGDFSSWLTYEDKTVRGNTARIFYGHVYLDQKDIVKQKEKEREKLDLCLARSAHILTQDISFIPWFNADTFADFSSTGNGKYEYDRASLAQWQLLATLGPDDDKGAMVKRVILNTFRRDPGPTGTKTPGITLENLDPDTLHKLLAQGIGSFSIEIAYWEKNNTDWELRWFPIYDPSGTESHFGGIEGEYGLLFNLSAPIDWDEEWFNSIDALNNSRAPNPPLNRTNGNDYIFPPFPDALKFTLRIYDSKGIIKGGRTFTHIVYLND
ncbi:MAG: hypothetical protein WCZ89_02540 [Phycisphaerae bacterium]